MSELTIPMTRAEKLLFEKINSIERKIDELREEKGYESIEEISLFKAARLLHVGEEKVLRLVETKKLRAIPYRDNDRKKRYRFRVADIREYQNKRQTQTADELQYVESAESIAKRIFGVGNEK
jgi:hypothetical protein